MTVSSKSVSAIKVAALCSLLVLSACETNNQSSAQPGSYNYTPNFVFGPTTATQAVTADGSPGFIITCADVQYCMRRATDVCQGRPVQVVQSAIAGGQSSVAVSAYGGGGRTTTQTIMEIKC